MKKYIIGAIAGIIIGAVGTSYAGYWNATVDVYTDPDTKIQYLIVEKNTREGVGVGICPRYTSSGNLMYVGSEIVE